MKERWWFKDPDWYHKWELVRAEITETPSPEAINLFLRNVPVFEQRFLTGVKADLEYWKSIFEKTRSDLAAKGKSYTLPHFCKIMLDYEVAGFNLQERSRDLLNKRNRMGFVLDYEFFSEMMFLLAPLGIVQDSEIGHALEPIRTYQALIQEDPTGFKLVDHQLEFIKDLVKSPVSDPLFPIWTAGHEFGNRVYKELFTLLNSGVPAGN